MLAINPETVCRIIEKAREFHAKEAVSIPEIPNSPSDDWARQVLADHVDDPSYNELIITINDLEPDQQICLVALMWLGRGDYSLEEWDEAIATATDAHNERTAEYLIATPLVADYLGEGLNLHEYACEE